LLLLGEIIRFPCHIHLLRASLTLTARSAGLPCRLITWHPTIPPPTPPALSIFFGHIKGRNLSEDSSYINDLKRKYNSFPQLIVDAQFVSEQKNIADAFTNNFKSTFHILLHEKFCCGLRLQSLPRMSAGLWIMLMPPSSVGLHGITFFIIMGSAYIFIQFLNENVILS
jgi:hypothetical protein